MFASFRPRHVDRPCRAGFLSEVSDLMSVWVRARRTVCLEKVMQFLIHILISVLNLILVHLCDSILPVNIYYLKIEMTLYFEPVEQIAEMVDTFPCYLGSMLV